MPTRRVKTRTRSGKIPAARRFSRSADGYTPCVFPRMSASGAVVEGGKLRLLQEIAERMSRGASVDELLDLLYGRLAEFLPYHRIAVAVTDERHERLSIVAARSDGKMILGTGYAGAIAGSSLEPLIREGRTRVINDLQQYLREKPSSDSTRLIVKEGMRASVTLPLLVEGKPIGVMFFSSREPHVYRPNHEEFLRAIVGHVALAVERSRLADALREKSEYLENILENSADAIVVVDNANRIRTWNAGAARMFGYEPSEVVGADYAMFIPAEEREAGEVTRIKKLVEDAGYVQNYECTRLTKDGRRLRVNVTSTLLRDRRGRTIGRSSIVRDVTDVKHLQEELVRTQSLAAVGELAATVAHEIKNPLAGISGAIQVLAEALPADRRDIVGEILDQIRRLDDTVRDLLVFARPATPALQSIDLRDTLARAWALLGTQPATAQIRFAIEGSAAPVSADPQLLHQVWVNLLQNAIEAMPAGGDLTVRVTDGATPRVDVHDAGTGIRPEHAAKLFRPFFSTKTRGTGLGLAISRKIIEAHGGTITIESRPERGTRVRVELARRSP